MTKQIMEHDSPDWRKLANARERVIHAIAQNIDLYGISPSIGRLYGTMYFRDQPMTLDEMSDALGMSKTSMSTGIRSLLDINMVHKTWQKGVRKDLYNVEEDWYITFIDLFTTKWRKGIEVNEHEIKKAKSDLEMLLTETSDDEIKTMIEHDLLKLRHALDYYEWLTRLVKSFETGDIFKFIPKPGEGQDK